jgi:hypothetical protein
MGILREIFGEMFTILSSGDILKREEKKREGAVMEEWSSWEVWTAAEKGLCSGDRKEQAKAVVTLGKQMGQVDYTGDKDKWGTLKPDSVKITHMEEGLGPTSDRVKRFNGSWYLVNPVSLILSVGMFLVSLATMVLYLDLRGELPEGEISQKLLELSAFAQPWMEKSVWFLLLGTVIGAVLWFFVMPVHMNKDSFITVGTLVAMGAPVAEVIYGLFGGADTLAEAALVPFFLVTLLGLLCFMATIFDVQRMFIGRHTLMKKKAYDQECESIKKHLERCKKGAAEAKKYYQEDVNCLMFLQKQGVTDENSFLVALAAVEKYYEDLGKKLQNI